MAQVILDNVEQVIRKVVKADGRVGGLHAYKNERVDVIIYQRARPDIPAQTERSE